MLATQLSQLSWCLNSFYSCRPMSHLQFYRTTRTTLLCNFITRQSCSAPLRMLNTAINHINEPNKRGFLWLWWWYYCNQFIPLNKLRVWNKINRVLTAKQHCLHHTIIYTVPEHKELTNQLSAFLQQSCTESSKALFGKRVAWLLKGCATRCTSCALFGRICNRCTGFVVVIT